MKDNVINRISHILSCVYGSEFLLTDEDGGEVALRLVEALKEGLEFFIWPNLPMIPESEKDFLLKEPFYLKRWRDALEWIGKILGWEIDRARVLELGAGPSYREGSVFYKRKKMIFNWGLVGEPLAARVLGYWGVDTLAVDPQIDPEIERLYGLRAIKRGITIENAKKFVGDNFDIVFSLFPYTLTIQRLLEIGERVLKLGGVFFFIDMLFSSTPAAPSICGKMRLIFEKIDFPYRRALYQKFLC